MEKAIECWVNNKVYIHLKSVELKISLGAEKRMKQDLHKVQLYKFLKSYENAFYLFIFGGMYLK